MSNGTVKKELITKSISMPSELFLAADERVKAEQELDWSKYVRGLIRKDLAEHPLPGKQLKLHEKAA
jgi:metal-responsive CopG/Arc/MetJ family transcriptional regulator